MKKLLPAVAGAFILCAGAMTSSCNSSSAPKDFNDSLSIAIGEFQGTQLCAQYNQMPEEIRARFNKAQILEGIKAMVMTDTARQSYVSGLQIGMQLWGQIFQLEQAGIKVDRKAVYEAYASAFMADTIADGTLQELGINYQKLNDRAQKIMMDEQQRKAEAERQAKAEAPEAKKAAADGAAYVAAQKKNDASIKTTDSGLSYKVVTEGQGDNVQANDRVKINYIGRHIDGSEFDKGEGAVFPVRGVVPGFAEGLQLMKKGGKYMLYIPGDLAYGVDGTPDGSIQPMETLVFEVEVIDIVK